MSPLQDLFGSCGRRTSNLKVCSHRPSHLISSQLIPSELNWTEQDRRPCPVQFTWE